MVKTYPNKVVFNAGELDDLVEARNDVNNYRFGNKKLENFVVTPEGPPSLRTGSRYVGTLKDECRLVPFVFSEDVAYNIEAGTLYFRFWNPNQLIVSSAAAWSTTTAYVVGDYVTQGGIIYYCQIAHTSGTFATDLAAFRWVAQTILELPHDMDLQAVREAVFFSVGDWVYVAHPDYTFSKLIRESSTVWSFGPVDWTYPPFRTQNVDRADTLACSVTALGASGTLTAVGHTPFAAEHVGSYWEIKHRNAGTVTENNIHSTASASKVNHTAVEMTGQYSVSTSERWWGTVTLERSFDGGSTWETVKEVKSFADKNYIFSGEESEIVQLRTTFTAGGDVYGVGSGEPYNASTSPPTTYNEATVKLEVEEHFQSGFVQITAVASSTSATATVKKKLQSTAATIYWAEGAFSDFRGHPSAVNLVDGQLVLTGNKEEPNRVWKSVGDDFENFKYGTSASDAFRFVMQGVRNRVQWTHEKDGKLMVGTSGEEKIIYGPLEEPFTAVNPPVVKTGSSNGSARLPALDVNDSLLYVQGGGRRVKELVYSFEKDGYRSENLTRLSKSITGDDGLIDVTKMRTPENQYIGIRADGQLAVLMYEKDENVVGWSRFKTRAGDTYFAANGLPDGTGDDLLYVGVKRSINGSTVHYLEYFDKGDWYNEEDPDDVSRAIYLDCSNRYSLLSGDMTSLQLITQGGTSLFGFPGGTASYESWRWKIISAFNHNLDTGDLVRLKNTGFDAIDGVVCQVLKESATAFTLVSITDVFTITNIINTGPMPSNAGADVYSNTQIVFSSSTPFGIAPKSVFIYDVSGMTNVNGLFVPIIQNAAGEYFLDGIDSTAFGAYTFGGFAAPSPIILGDYNDLVPATVLGGQFEEVSNQIGSSSWLEGETVRCLVDGSVVDPEAAVSSGRTTFPAGVYGNTVVWGFPYTGDGETMKLDIMMSQGSLRGRKQVVHDMMVSLYRTVGGRVGINRDRLVDVHKRNLANPTDTNQTLLNGEVRLIIASGQEIGLTVKFQQDQPLPFTLTGLIPKLSTATE